MADAKKQNTAMVGRVARMEEKLRNPSHYNPNEGSIHSGSFAWV